MDIDSDDSSSESTKSPACLPGEKDAIGDLPVTLKWIYDTGNYSDITIILGDNKFKLHKAVVCGQSPYLRRATLGLRVMGSRQIKPPFWNDFKILQAYEAVFRFMYGLKYDDNPDPNSCMSFHAEVYRLARCFEISRLPELAFENLEKCLKASWDAYEFLGVLRPEWDGLWSACVPICREHITELLSTPTFRVMLEIFPVLAFELTEILGKSLRSYSCPECNQTWSLDCSLSSPSYCPTCGHHEQDWTKFRTE